MPILSAALEPEGPLDPSGDPGMDLVMRDLLVLEVPLQALGYQALLGREVLAVCDFLYQGRQGRWQLSY